MEKLFVSNVGNGAFLQLSDGRDIAWCGYDTAPMTGLGWATLIADAMNKKTDADELRSALESIVEEFDRLLDVVSQEDGSICEQVLAKAREVLDGKGAE